MFRIFPGFMKNLARTQKEDFQFRVTNILQILHTAEVDKILDLDHTFIKELSLCHKL